MDTPQESNLTKALYSALQTGSKPASAGLNSGQAFVATFDPKAWADKQAKREARPEPTIAPLPPETIRELGFQQWAKRYITEDPETQEMLKAAMLYALGKSNEPVVIYGETGTGKEILARILHGTAAGAFVAINCGGIPEDLLESELFGHVRGAFTGAHTDKKGLFSAAHGGTIFLDEVIELPLNMQVKLLRVLQERVIRRVGSTTNEAFDCKLICATHESLAQAVEQKRFRADLYYRLEGIIFRTKPLRSRMCDVLPIAISLGWPKDKPLPLDQLSPDLRGNVRELQHFVARHKFQSMLDEQGIQYKVT